MARRAPARKGKKAASSSSKPTAKRKGTTSRASKDVFSDDEEQAAHQERAINARADVDEVFEYEEPTFDQEDSEVDEDEAFNSDDEASYGMFFNNKKAKQQEEEDDDEEEEEEGGDLLSDLLGKTPASRLSTASDDEDDEEEKIKNLGEMVDSLVEKKNKKKLEEIDSQFASESAEGELTLGSLLGAQTLKPGAEGAEEEEADEKTKTGLDLRRVRQQVRELEGDGTTLTLQADRDPVHDARAQRKLAYVEKSKEVDIFEPVVRRNRNKETLDLRVQAPKLEKLTPAALTSKFVAQTDMEKSVAALLQAGDLSDKKLAKDEEEELARKRVSTEEVVARQKELAKLRSLLFYEEQKQRRVKKIKSKLYHKIRNAQDKKAMAKQKEELRALDPELARKLDEELAEKRAEERLTLKHRNTSKWVKHQLRRGIQADDATRSAIADQLRRGEELRRKMNAVDSDDDMDEDEDEDEEEGDAASRLQKRLEKQASALVTEIDEDSAEAGKKRGLQGMKFMQRAAEKQREKARSKAEKLLREIRSGDGADGDRILSEGEDYLSSGDEGAKKSKKSAKKTKQVVATEQDKAAVDRALAGGALQTANVSMNGGVSARASGAIAIDLGDGGSGVALANGDKKQSKKLELGAKSTQEKTTVVETQARTDTEDADMEPAAEGEENPWLSNAATKSKRSKRNKKKTQSKGAQADVAAAIESLAQDTKESRKEDSAIATLTSSSKTSKKRKLDQSKTEPTEVEVVSDKKTKKKAKREAKAAGQDELVRRAFEFVAEDEDELAQEKGRLASQDADAKKGAEIAKLVGMSGWGSWAGDGVRVSKRQIAREQQAKDIAREAKQKALAGRKDARLEKVLINEKKDKKAAKFTVKDVPYPFTSRAEYEAAMRNPLGSDWNTSQVTNVLTAPKIMKHAGTAIAPLTLSKEDRKQAKKELSLKRKAKF
ncbi:Utp14 protein [Phytophthora infestans]|uniref:Utp14 protein n=1 Tax=Phytophthora infestans TaxID=4787 RepID=A0A8S9V467_PHYIN|nr:Utp14 protein [Phytophthora infestans]